MIQFLFHSVCAQYARVVSLFQGVILDAERRIPELSPTETFASKCIYCPRSDGDFGPEEHVIPEALGVDELVLRGVVCASCNHELSKLDQRLCEFEPLALLRVVNVPLTKKGKFPRATLREFDVQKTKPRELNFSVKSRQDPFTFEELPEGRVRVHMKTLGRSPFNPVELARSLFKIGLGLVAHDAGEAVAYEPRYDRAREFIRGGGYFPNHLLMSAEVQPESFVRACWQPFDGSTLIVLSFYGVRFVFNIEPTPFDMPDGVEALKLDSCWLGEPSATPG